MPLFALAVTTVVVARTEREVTWVLDSSRHLYLAKSVAFSVEGDTLALPSGEYLLLASGKDGAYWIHDGRPFLFCGSDKSLSVGGVFVPTSNKEPYGIWAARELRPRDFKVIYLSPIPRGDEPKFDEKTP